MSTAEISDAALLYTVNINGFHSYSALKCDMFASDFFFFKLVILIKKGQDLCKAILLVTVRRGISMGYLKL
jgi:hypothetical protein